MNRLRLLVTRAQPQAAATAQTLSERGASVLLSPLLTIVPTAAPTPDLTAVQAVLATSAAALPFLAPRADGGPLVLCVGDASALAARARGFAQVVSAQGDVAALADLAARRLDREGGLLLHPRGADAAGDLEADLERRGFTVRSVVLYRAEASARFSPEAAEALGAAPPRLDRVLFHSRRAADVFERLASPEIRQALTAVCMSARVAEAAMGFADVRVALRPTDADLIEAALRP